MRSNNRLAVMFASLGLFLVAGELSPAQTVKNVYSFAGGASADPVYVTPAQGRDARIYGTTSGVFGTNGTIFALASNGKLGNSYVLNGSNGSGPVSGLTLATDGRFYGTASAGGSAGLGVLFKYSGNSYVVLHDFAGGLDGAVPSAPPIEGPDGTLYGTTNGNTTTASTIYKYTTSGAFSTIYQFDQAHGQYVVAPLILATDGNLYGTASEGGASNCGSIFKLTTSGTILFYYSFPCGTGGLTPIAPLVQASDGDFYGTTEEGGNGSPLHSGIVFKLDQSGAVSILHNFGSGADGAGPTAGLVQATDGTLYGATEAGGGPNEGVLFKITTSGAYEVIYTFSGKIAGYVPLAALAQNTNGLLYGTALAGGKSSYGAVYSLDMGLGPFVTFVLPTGKVRTQAQILGQGLTGTTSVTFNGLAASSFSVVSDTYMTAVVPSGATTGPVVVTTPSGPLTSNVNFRVSQ